MAPETEPTEILGQWAEAQEKMQRAKDLQEEAAAASRAVVHQLADSGHTYREIASLLDISYQRVAQLNKRKDQP